MSKFEYDRECLPPNDSVWCRIFTNKGILGWELVQIIGDMAYFKREIKS